MDELTAALGDSEVSAIKLSGDLSTNSTFNINRDLEIDLNGNTLTSTRSNGYLFYVNSGKLTLKNGNVTTAYRMGRAYNEGSEIIIESGTYTSGNVAFEAGRGGKVTLNGGKIISVEGGIIAPVANGIIEVNGGEIETSDNFAISTNGNSGNSGNVITVNGGKLIGNIRSTGYEAIGVYIANNDTFVMNGGEIIANGGTGLCMRGGSVTINDGKITATGVDKNGNAVADGKIGDDSYVATGISAIVYHKKSPYAGNTIPMKLTINGGIITGVDKSIDVVSDEENPDITVSGGTLTPAYAA